MIIVGSRAAELRGISLHRKAADIDIIGTPEEMDAFRRANTDLIRAERGHGSRRKHFLLRHPLYKKVEFGTEDFPSNALLRNLCRSDRVKILQSECFLPSPNVLALTKRCHLNYPWSWDKHFRDYVSLLDYLTEPTPEEKEYFEQCRIEVRARYAKRGVDYKPAVRRGEAWDSSYRREDVLEAIALRPEGPVCRTRGIDIRPGLIERDRFNALGDEDRLRFAQELFIAIGVDERRRQQQDLNKFAVYRLGMRIALRDLYAGWFQDYCLDNLATLRFAPDEDYMVGYEAAEREGRLRPAATTGLDVEAELARARMLHEAGRVVEAELGYRAVLAQEADNVVALHQTGVLMHRAGHIAEAERLLGRAASLEPQNWRLYTSLAFLFQRTGRLDEAAANYRRGIELNPRFVPARMALGRTLAEAGQIDEAIKVCRGALRIAPQDKSAAEFLRDLYRRRGVLQEASDA